MYLKVSRKYNSTTRGGEFTTALSFPERFPDNIQVLTSILRNLWEKEDYWSLRGCIVTLVAFFFTFTISFINISYWSTSSLFAPSVLSAEVPQQLQGKNPNLLDRHLFLHSKWSLIRPPDPLTSYLSCRSVGENVCSFSRYFGRMGLSLIGSPCLPSSQARVTSEK